MGVELTLEIQSFPRSEADGSEKGTARGDVPFHLNRVSINAEDGGTRGFEEHRRSSLRETDGVRRPGRPSPRRALTLRVMLRRPLYQR